MTLLEIQVTNLDEDVDFLFDETVIQDERLFSLEQDTDAINTELDLLEDTIESEFLKNWLHQMRTDKPISKPFIALSLYFTHIHHRSTGHNSGFGFPSDSPRGEWRG